MTYDELIDWLFEKTSLKPQLGFAGRNKSAWCWLPGKSMPRHETIARAMKNAPLQGCTQLAYEDWFAPMAGQRCEICWVGLDIDAEDNPGIDLTAIDYSASMVRTSCSGRGVHVIYRLAEPVTCTHETANRIVKTITAPLVAELPVRVCKADKRMFWMCGGENRIIQQSDWVLRPDIDMPVLQSITAPPTADFQVTPLIQEWLVKLNISGVRKSTPIYIAEMVSLLRGLGEKVETRSSCRGNGQVNGYLDVTPTSISLWSYADGFAIWNFTDVEALLDA